VEQTAEQFNALCGRLEAAATVLREHGSLLQAIARRYYLVYTVASRAAALHGIIVIHRTQAGDVIESGRFSHRVIPDVVKVLYTGHRSGTVSPSDHSGIVGATLREREAVRYAGRLQHDRLRADYGPTDTAEPYDAREADERLRWANLLTSDLRTLV
jgi:hypothetical protein